MTRPMTRMALGASALAFAAAAAQAQDVEAMHWWTSGGEAAAIATLQEAMAAQGYGWVDAPVAGGGGDAAMTALKARVTAGNPPTAAQMSLMAVQQWAGEGLLGDLTPVSEAEGWAEVIPPAVLEGASYDGQVVGVPFNIHRPNWLWMNAEVFAANGLSPPTTWDEFFAAGDVLRAAGIIPLALGGEPWQETIVFEDAIVAVGGADLYRRVLLDLDAEAMQSPEMEQAWDILRRVKDYIDPNYSGRAWNLATAMVLNGEAGMQLMGDWAKGEIVNAGLVPGEDILCAAAPGTAGTYVFNVDYFAMFPQEGEGAEAQGALAASIMDPAFQETFNLVKGSIPARTDVSPDNFDACAQAAMTEIKDAIANDTLVGALQGGAAQPPAIQGAVQDLVTQFFTTDMTSADANAALVAAVQGAM